jgi:23S rRNA (guanosine2251-2'-O)-methyltransferase
VAPGAGGKWLEEVRRLARAAGIRLRLQERAILDRVCGTPNHQGIAARRGSYTYRSEAELLDEVAALAEPALLVAADSLTDPMNLGNLCRSALAAGAHGLIIPKDRAAGVSPTVAKAAAGALEYLAVYRVTNLADCLSRLKDAGLTIIGTAAEASHSIYTTDLTQPLALVIGSEDKGLRPRVRKQCDLVVSIPMAAGEIGSLNAATSGAIALFEARRQRLVSRRWK